MLYQQVIAISVMLFVLASADISSLNGAHLTVSVIGSSPYIIYGKELTGVDIDVLNILSSKFKFTYQLSFETTWGSEDKTTGNWSGTVGKVRNRISFFFFNRFNDP